MEQESKILEKKEKPLSGKVALITGASRDLGASTAKALGLDGATIISPFREKAKRAAHMKKYLSLQGIDSEFLQADITIPQDREKLAEAIRRFKRLDFLVLNASGKTTEINVTAANALIDQFLPIMPRGSMIIQMQSIPGHFAKQLKDLFLTPEFYEPIAQAKYAGEESVRKRIPEFKEKGINYIVVCPPEIPETNNMRVFERYDPKIHDKNDRISELLGLPKIMKMEDVGKRIAELTKRNDLPLGHTEFFNGTIDARRILDSWYGDDKTYVDTLEIKDNKNGVGRLIVTKDQTKGHFNETVGISLFRGVDMIEASAQTLGLIALNGKISEESMPIFQGIGLVKFLRTASPADILKICGTITETSKRGFKGSVKIENQKGEAVAQINDLKAVIVKKEIAKKVMGLK